ncbi:hypothetical protein EDB84DRAFT_1659384 [Lactarius hengduanensis]|nr:hypothetical protein EDB84DRAFT_1659384 [Lactarius hengduanensis]
MSLTPAYFMQAFGHEKVELTDCELGDFKRGTLKDLLKLFDSPQDTHNPVWKVKDWPSRATFKGGKFAEIYEEFEDCLPFPHLTRLNGHDNLAAHFPDDAGLRPDLRPKVYFALATKQDDQHHGSTRLHCDLTDAINVCIFAAQQSDGSAGGARWDIFSPEDTTRLREVIQVHNEPEDPVLAQNTYLSPSALCELELQHGIKASTFIQREGEAVFIPAGCAHQVSNVTSSIKIACDFISVKHLPDTIRLVSTFRQHRIFKQSGDDVLQLYTTLLHAWCSLARFHELYSKDPHVGSEGCGENSGTWGSSAVDASSSDAMAIRIDHAPPHMALSMPVNSDPPSRAAHGSQSRRRRKVGQPRRNGDLSCPVAPCKKQKFKREGLLSHICDVHTVYKLKDEVSKWLCDVNNCSPTEFSKTVSDHVDQWRKLVEQARKKQI